MTTKEQEPVRVINLFNLRGTSAFPSAVTLEVVWQGGRGRLFIGALTLSGVDSKIAVSFAATIRGGFLTIESGLPPLITSPGTYQFEAPPGVLSIQIIAGAPDGVAIGSDCWLFKTV